MAQSSSKSLVIVESPAKAKTINKFLGREFVVKASMGHVRDLPKSQLGVDEESFDPTYAILPSKKKIVSELKKSAETAAAVYLAPDPDREGEAICWHLRSVLKAAKKKFYRVEFNEITRRAILAAMKNPRQIDQHKVDAQQARRILDRLVGYKISPLLWEKVRRGLSAGRVQSVALRIIVERERDIRAFKPEEYWSIIARLAAGQPPEFEAKCVARDGQKISLGSEADAAAVLQSLEAAEWRVASVSLKEKKKNPPPPFITSKLQQDAARRHGYPVAKTMRLAQGLYEGKDLGEQGSVGLITYMRTDSPRVSEEALAAARDYIRATYGEEALPEKPRYYRSAKDAQDAHEAIRPTSLDMPPPSVAPYLSRDELNVYTLIWNRFVASQMEPAVYDTAAADVEAAGTTFRAAGQVLRSPGWLAVYQEQEENGAKPDDKEGENEMALPPLREGDLLRCLAVTPRQHFTQPPPRFSEASLVKELEDNGIGRPSTYATILQVLQTRDYVEKEKGRFLPTALGELVTDLIVKAFGDIVQVEYTARMEGELDEIEEGRLDWREALREFYGKFSVDLERARIEMPDVKRQEIPTDISCDKCGKPMVRKWGRYGEFLACSGYPDCKNTRELASSGNGTGPGAAGGDQQDRPGGGRKRRRSAVEAPSGSGAPAGGDTQAPPAQPAPVEVAGAELNEMCPKCGTPMVVKRGRFGQFLACSAYPRCKTTRRLHVDAEGKLGTRPDVRLEETCPLCGQALVVRHGRFGDFTCCSEYPSCRYIKLKETGVDCPREGCGGKIVERRSKRGRLFFGCDSYPKCDFVLWSRPVARRCPSCGAAYLLEKFSKREGRFLACARESCNHTEPLAATPEPEPAAVIR